MCRKEIPIFFSSDDNYIPFLAVAIRSIIDNSSDEYDYKINILNTGLKTENEIKIKKLETSNFKIDFININKKIEGIANDLSLRLRDYYSNSIYLRIFIPSLFQNYDKVLYLDADIVVIDDIAKLYFEDIGDNLLGAITDDVINTNETFTKYSASVLGLNKGEYFNSGILVMNLEGLRKNKIEEKFVHLLGKYNFDTIAPDQDYLNYLCKGKVKFIHKGWDKMPIYDASFEGEPLHLVHYNMFQKPWHYENVLYEEHFWDYAKRTEFYGDMLNMKAAYTNEQKKSDEQAAIELVKHAARIINAENTFNNALANDYFLKIENRELINL